MTAAAAALALALAVLLLPADARWRTRAVMSVGRRKKALPAPACGAAACVTVSLASTPMVAVALGMLLGTLLVRRRIAARRRRRADEGASLQGVLDVLVGELRVGAHPVAAIDTAAQETDGRMAASLGAVAARAVLGADVAAGLRTEGRSSPSPRHWDRLAVCWQLAQTHGLAIATLLQAAQRDISERERFRSRVEAGMAGARATAAILAGLPLLGVLLGHAIGAEPLTFLLSGGAGGGLLVLGTLFVCCGLLWSDRITSRVLA